MRISCLRELDKSASTIPEKPECDSTQQRCNMDGQQKKKRGKNEQSGLAYRRPHKSINVQNVGVQPRPQH